MVVNWGLVATVWGGGGDETLLVRLYGGWHLAWLWGIVIGLGG